MEENAQPKSSLREAREGNAFTKWLKRYAPWLFSWRSTFYYGVFLFLLAVTWGIVGLIANSFTNFYNFDYVSQFVPFAYDFWDDWHTFFATGQFPLYTARVFIGVDNIGSNSYYGLFDPFVVALVIFPRSWIPQMFAVMTFAKFMVTGLLGRWYLRYMGISERSARLGGIAIAFSGYVNFMIAFPTTVAAVTYVPLILLGIEKVIKEKKISCLVWGLFLEGITSFFFLVVLCIFGVMYAVWRYFWTIKTRSKADNWKVIGLGVLAFGLGIAMCSWTLLPSVRESSLSGRTSSIGKAYLHAIIESLKSHDVASFFGLVFGEVGDNPGRELMSVLSFFYPTVGFITLPLASSGYDAWTASIFVYTPCVILLFVAILESLRRRKWCHIIGLLAIVYMLLTNFSYFFFYAFSGNGYGRWFMVLIPVIVWYCCWGLDQRMEAPKWVPMGGTVLALALTLTVYLLTESLLKDKTFSNPNDLSYWISSYYTAGWTTNSHAKFPTMWVFIYQLCILTFEGAMYVIASKRTWMPNFFLIMMSIEVAAMGNISYTYHWSFSGWMSGQKNINSATEIAARISSSDSGFYRTYMDQGRGHKTFQDVAGYNASGTFHSLMNFDVEDFALMNHMKTPGGFVNGTYNNESFYNPNWSGYYGNKRFGTDTALGYRYYAVEDYYGLWAENVPFTAERDDSLSPDPNNYRVYRVKDEYYPSLGHAVDSSRLYRIGREEDNPYRTDWYLWGKYDYDTYLKAYRELMRISDVELFGAIFDDDVTVPDTFLINETVPVLTSYGKKIYSRSSASYGYKCEVYTSEGNDKFFPAADSGYDRLDPLYFLTKYTPESISSRYATLVNDYGHLVLSPKTGTYFNADPKGAYFDFKISHGNQIPRVVFYGDTFDEEGNLVAENKPLAFEHQTFSNAKGADRVYFSGEYSTFGVYVKNARVKGIMICFPAGSRPDSTVSFDIDRCFFEITEYTDYMAKIDELMDGALQNVKHGVNDFTFSTNYEEDRIVVTTLGYDKGWSVTAKLEDGTTKACQMYRLDGGLVGFIAPKGANTYVMKYVTPYLPAATALTIVAFTTYVSVIGYCFFKSARKMRRKLEIEA